MPRRFSLRAQHHLDGSGNWARCVYQTNVRIGDDGEPWLYQVKNLDHIQELTVHKGQPLVGFHMVACVEWDASSSYMVDLRQGLEQASRWLYDVSGGQFLWGAIEVIDNHPGRIGCDMRILASNQRWPSAHRGGG